MREEMRKLVFSFSALIRTVVGHSIFKTICSLSNWWEVYLGIKQKRKRPPGTECVTDKKEQTSPNSTLE
jgi:hypothetical protein